VPSGRLTELLPGVEIEGDQRAFTIRFDRFAHTAGEVMTGVLAAGEVADFRLDEPAIEDVIRRVYAGDLQLTGESA
jgi:ABC-2 type transport system ATP-binding protein